MVFTKCKGKDIEAMALPHSRLFKGGKWKQVYNYLYFYKNENLVTKILKNVRSNESHTELTASTIYNYITHHHLKKVKK